MRGYFKSFVLMMTLLLSISTIKAQQISYNDSWGAHGFSLVEDDGNTIKINYSLTNIYLEDINVEGKQLKSVKVPGIFLPNNEGFPDLAGTGRYIAIPQGAKVSYSIIASRTEKMENIDIAPAPRIPLDTEDGPMQYEKNIKIYTKNAYYPSNNVKLKTSKIRGVDVVMVGITPFQYNPVTKELIVYRDLEIELTISGGTGHIGEDRLRSRWWDPIIYNAVLNPNSIPVMDYSIKPKNSKSPDFEYIIIVPNDAIFISYANQIKDWRNKQGINTGIVTTTDIGGNTTSDIETYVDDAYTNWDVPPVAVLLLGDYGSSGNTVMSSADISHPYSGTYVTDNVFADVNGDGLPEMAFARMTARDNTELGNMINKFINYENSPPVDANFYNNPISALGWQDDRWFQICSEVVGGFWNNELGKSTVRINALGSPANNHTTGPWSTATNTAAVMNYFGPSGLEYIPSTPQELGGFIGGTASMVNGAINSGSFMLQHRDHGGEAGWGEPDYSSSDLSGLGANDPIFVMSINCLTGRFDYGSEVFAEAFHRMEYGALGLIAASQVSYSFVNDAYVWGLYDYMWPDFDPGYGSTGPINILPCFGNASGKYYLQASSWPYNTTSKAITYDLFHHHGDAFSTVYSEVPQNLTVIHNPSVTFGATSFDVTVDDGSFIALTVDGEIIGTDEATGSQVSVSIDPQSTGGTMVVTVTKQNYYRYEQNVSIIPSTEPHVSYNSHTIIDAAGNNNGQADFGEDIVLELTLENSGVLEANNVGAELSSSDLYVSISNSTQTFGDIAALGGTATQSGYEFTIAENVPDQHVLNFELAISADPSYSWPSSFTIDVNAPNLETGTLVIDDANGKLDPGETVDILVETSNTGHSNSPNTMGSLTSASPYITINNGSYDFGSITYGTTEIAVFNVSVSGSATPGTIADFDFDVVAGLYFASNSYTKIIGQVPVLILDLDPAPGSGTLMGTAITNNGVAYEYLTAFPADLNLYSSVFVCLGIYSSNHVLSSSEGTILANYLNNGGNLYMEGGDSWAYDTQTAVHEMFNIDGISDGTSDMSIVSGQTGTFTQGMSFNYSGANNYMDHISAISPAVLILENQTTTPYGTGVAYDEGTYKTIGTSHEFGGLDDGTSPSTKDELMFGYLEFFGLTGTSINLTAFLEGPFNGTEMTTGLNSGGHLPLDQPYTISPWNYAGGESVESIPVDIVDWVLVELRETTGDVTTASPSKSIARRAGFLQVDGSILDLDGESDLSFDVTITDNVFAVIYHRNHLGIISAYPLTFDGDAYIYNFSTDAAQVYGGQNGHKEITIGIWGMFSGDANVDGEIDNKDKNDNWKIQMGLSGYYSGDFDMNGQVEMDDKITKWKSNTGNCSFIIK